MSLCHKPFTNSPNGSIMSAGKQKAKPKSKKSSIILKSFEMKIAVSEMAQSILDSLLSDTDHILSGRFPILSLLHDPLHKDWLEFDHNEVYVYSNDLLATIRKCEFFNHVPNISVKVDFFNLDYNKSSSVQIAKIRFEMQEKCILRVHCYDSDDKKLDHQDKFYVWEFFHFNKCFNRMYNMGYIFNDVKSPNIMNSVLSEYRKGYASVMPPITDFHSIKRRLKSNLFWYQNGVTPIHGLMKTYGEITIGTSFKAIREFHPELFKKRFEGGKCPISNIDYSEMEYELVVFTNTLQAYKYEWFIRLLESEGFKGECPVTKEILY